MITSTCGYRLTALPHFRIRWLKRKSMKTRRTHRLKLRFSSAKDAAPVKAQQTAKRPVKRRARSNRERRVSPVTSCTTRHPNGLPTALWSHIEERFAAAKSLGEITRATLQFFKEHEDLQGATSNPDFPIFIPASEIYRMKVPRKRRIYDVLHVLEGVGVIKRERGETKRTKGGYFLYYGEAAMLQHLSDMKSNSANVMLNFRQSCGSRVATVVEKDGALVKAFEDQATAEQWPCLVTTTVCFLALLFQQDYQVTVLLPEISDRLVEAKKFIGALVPRSGQNESPFSDVQRRLYDVASVLVGCNLILTSPSLDKTIESPTDYSGKICHRKHLRFNYGIFTDVRVLFATSPRETLYCSDHSGYKALLSGALPSPLAWQSSKMSASENSLIVSSPSACLRGLDHKASVSSVSALPLTKCQQEQEQTVPVQDLFSPLGKEVSVKNEWCDGSLTQLGLFDALPIQDQIDWKLNKQFKDIYREMWGSMSDTNFNAPIEMKSHQFSIDRVDMKVKDLQCHEVLTEDKDHVTANFFC